MTYKERIILSIQKKINKRNIYLRGESLRTLKLLVPNLVKNNLIPSRLTPSEDKGFCLVFKDSEKIIYLEFYNDEDIGLISEDINQKKIIDNIDLTKNNVVETLLTIYKGEKHEWKQTKEY